MVTEPGLEACKFAIVTLVIIKLGESTISIDLSNKLRVCKVKYIDT